MVLLGSPSLAACAPSHMRLVAPGRHFPPAALLLRGASSAWEPMPGSRAPSAAERLEADKAKYVKSQQVISRRQEPALHSCSPRLAPRGRRLLALQQRHELCQASERGHDGPRGPPGPPSPVSRRGGGRRLLRPDSLIIYRQKRDCPPVSKESAKGAGLVRRLFQGSARDKGPQQDKVPGSPSSPMQWVPVGQAGARPPRAGESAAPGKAPLGLRASLPLSEQERFFNYCGLDRALVELLGRERFAPAGWDAAPARPAGSCESEASRASRGSAEDAEEEPGSRAGAAVSIVERNARVIKWLYGCQRAWADAKESTV